MDSDLQAVRKIEPVILSNNHRNAQVEDED